MFKGFNCESFMPHYKWNVTGNYVLLLFYCQLFLPLEYKKIKLFLMSAVLKLFRKKNTKGVESTPPPPPFPNRDRVKRVLFYEAPLSSQHCKYCSLNVQSEIEN